MPLGNPPVAGKEDQLAQVYMGECKPRSIFLGVQAFGCFVESLQRRSKRRQGCKSPVHSRALAKDDKAFVFVAIAKWLGLFIPWYCCFPSWLIL